MSSDTFSKGMLRDRRPTDIAFIIGFIVFMVLVGGIGIAQGFTSDTRRLLAKQDADRNFCGITQGFEDYPLVYWTFGVLTSQPGIDNNTQAVWHSAVCVKECPDGETDVQSPGTSFQLDRDIQIANTVNGPSTKRGIIFKDSGDIGGECIIDDLSKISN